MHSRVECLDPAFEHFREPCHITDTADGDACRRKGVRRTPCGNDLHPQRYQAGSELYNPGLVGNAQERSARSIRYIVHQMITFLSHFSSISFLFYLISLLSHFSSISFLFYLISLLSHFSSISFLFYLISLLSHFSSISFLNLLRSADVKRIENGLRAGEQKRLDLPLELQDAQACDMNLRALPQGFSL